MPWTVKDVERHKKGLTAKQKRQWVAIANGALKRCLDEGRSQEVCEASAIRQANSVAGNSVAFQVNNYVVRPEVHDGRRYLVVPVVMMVEGVHVGNHGPILHLSEELAKFPNAWNGMPVTIEHPVEDGAFVSANAPDTVETCAVGRVYNAYFDDKLRGEAWIDEEKIKGISPDAYEYIRQGRPLEVSVGIFSDDEAAPGEWRGERYETIARNYRPDHLALLPDGEGACSWADGCGVRANQQKGDNDVNNQKTDKLIDLKRELVQEGMSLIRLNQDKSFQQVISDIAKKLDTMDDVHRTFILQEVFEDSFVYDVIDRTSNTSSLFRRDYKVGGDGVLEFVGDPVPVERQVKFVEKKVPGTLSRTIFNGGKQMADKDKDTMCCLEKLNQEAGSTGGITLQIGEQKKPQDEKDKDKQAPVSGDKPKESVQVNRDQALEVLKKEVEDPEKAKDILQGVAKEQLEYGMQAYKERKEELIKTLVAANSEAFTEDELKTKGIGELEKLAKLVINKADYSGQGAGGPITHDSGKAEVLLPVGVEEEKK